MLLVDPKKQIFISKVSKDDTPRIINANGEEVEATEAHIVNLRKKDYFENRIKKGGFLKK